MGTAQRKEREKELRRSGILHAAEQIILEKGHENLNMDEVADRAELSKGTLYLYFSSKTELIIGIVHKAMVLLDSKISEVITRDMPGINLVHQIAIEYLNFAHEHPEYYAAMRFYENIQQSDDFEESEYSKLCTEYVRRTFSYTVRAIQIGMQDGTIDRSFDPKELAMLLWSSSEGIVYMSYLQKSASHLNFLGEVGFEIHTLFDSFMKLLKNGIASNEKITDL